MSLTILDGALHRGCGGRYALHTETVSMRMSGMAADVTREFYRCDKCGHEQRTIDQRDAAEKSASERIRAVHDLLTPRAIRGLRESLGLTVAQLADLCYGTPKGIVEGWEKGRYLQNREADQLLRSLEFPETLQRRAAKAGVILPSPADAHDSQSMPQPSQAASQSAPQSVSQPVSQPAQELSSD
jgi:putative zinc finger/helix-turn-helix YgiT family protein